jgi:nicotinamide mononucleotide (NMN) deamidase PncC
MQREFGLAITAITGPATDNEVGQVYITAGLGLPAHNARRDAAGLLAAVRRAIDLWQAGAASPTGAAQRPATAAAIA